MRKFDHVKNVIYLTRVIHAASYNAVNAAKQLLSFQTATQVNVLYGEPRNMKPLLFLPNKKMTAG
jgi:hypothetical protein